MGKGKIKKLEPKERKPEDRLRQYQNPVTEFGPHRDYRARADAHIENCEQLRRDIDQVSSRIRANLRDLVDQLKEMKWEIGDPQLAHFDPDCMRLSLRIHELRRMSKKADAMFDKALKMEALTMRDAKRGDPCN